MHHRRVFILSSLLIATAGLSVAAFLWNRILQVEQGERERHFITVHFLALEASWGELADDRDPPQDIDSLLDRSGGRDSAVMRPFPEGLVYRRQGQSFTLEEPRPRFVAWLRKDRLIATDRIWPRWESTGQPVRKFAEQVVPPAGFE